LRLSNKVAIITGSGSGIGQAEALLFAGEGAKVIVNDINEENGLKTVASIKDQGGEARFFRADVSQASEVEGLITFAIATYGGLKVLVNNAGVGFIRKGDGPTTETIEEIWDKVVDINLKGTFLCSKYAIPRMIDSGGGSIVNTSSVAAIRGAVSNAYASAKAGVIALTKSIALAYGKNNIRANAICPGHTMTPLQIDIAPTQEERDRLAAQIPVGRLAKPVEIAYAALFLASEEASFVNGAVLVVDGGQSA
jgi:NAD(P)-dependent dehydrogenase (short-subunit alcohol dehydrogenase family)